MRFSKHVAYAKALAGALEGANEKETKERTQKFLLILKKRGDIKRLPQTVREFRSLWQSRMGQVLEIVTAESLLKSVKNRTLLLARKRKFAVKETVDPRVIAGLAFFVGNNYMIDGTARTKLRRIFT